MPNIKQQKKRVRIAAEERLENLRYRSTVKTLTRRLAARRRRGRRRRVAEEHRELVRWIDQAAARGALHRNTAARKKAQAARLVSGAPAPSSRRASPGLGRPRDLDQRALELELAGQPAAALEREVEVGEPHDRARRARPG